METIRDAKDYLNENYKDGCKCPVCKQNVQLYKRKLNSGMARVLVAMYLYGDGLLHVKDHLRENNIKNTHDWTLLRFWNLISPAVEPEGGQEVGLWKITKAGKKFCRGEGGHYKHVLILLGEHIGYSNEKTNIQDSLGDHFDYNELIKGL